MYPTTIRLINADTFNSMWDALVFATGKLPPALVHDLFALPTVDSHMIRTAIAGKSSSYASTDPQPPAVFWHFAKLYRHKSSHFLPTSYTNPLLNTERLLDWGADDRRGIDAELYAWGRAHLLRGVILYWYDPPGGTSHTPSRQVSKFWAYVYSYPDLFDAEALLSHEMNGPRWFETIIRSMYMPNVDLDTMCESVRHLVDVRDIVPEERSKKLTRVLRQEEPADEFTMKVPRHRAARHPITTESLTQMVRAMWEVKPTAEFVESLLQTARDTQDQKAYKLVRGFAAPWSANGHGRNYKDLTPMLLITLLSIQRFGTERRMDFDPNMVADRLLPLVAA